MSTTTQSWVISLGVAGAGALAFLLVTLLTGDYDWVARLGGASWVFMLAVIILLPTVMPLMRERAAGQLTDVRQGGRVPAEGQAEASDLTEEVSEMAKDPVCGMDVDPETAAGSSEYKGGTYYFCNLNCKKSFDEDPERYLVGE